MEIRKIKEGELKQLAQLFDEYRVFYQQESDKASAETFLAERIKNSESEIFVAVSDEKFITGFVQLYPLFSSTRMKRLWLLNDLYVHPDFRGKGISKKLIEEAKELCFRTNACGFILETSKSNEIGNKLYTSVGLTLDTLHNHYYWDKE